MILYFLTPVIALFSLRLIGEKMIFIKNRECTKSVFLFLTFIIPFSIFAFRSARIGADTYIYCVDFVHIAELDIKYLLISGYNEYEKGFLLFCKLLSVFGKDPRILLIGSSLLINYLYSRVITDERNMWFLSVMVYFCLGNYLYNLNIMRQAISVGFILNSLHYLVEDKYWRYVILTLIASSFHVFALASFLFIIAVLLVKNKKQLTFGLILIGVFVFLSLELVHVIVQRYFTHFDYYFRHNYHSDQQFGITSSAYVILDAVVLFLIFENYEFNEFNRKWIVIYSISLLMASLGLLMMPRFGIYERIAKFYHPFLILSVPYAIEGLQVERTQRVMKIGIILFSSIYYAYIILTNAYRIVPFEFWNGL